MSESKNNQTTEETKNDIHMPDPDKLARAMNAVAEKSQVMLRKYMENNAGRGSNFDPFNLSGAFAEFMTRMMVDPSKIIKAQVQLWTDYMGLWDQTTKRLLGEESHAVIEPDKGDRRFSDEEWEKSTFFDFIKQSYLLSARWMQNVVHDVDGMDEKTQKKLDFYTRQFADAISPTNFALTNPTVLQATIESGGENLIKGLENLLKDIDENTGKLKISMTDKSAFKVGENLAITPGKVIFQNDLMQLIQYSPATETVFEKPLLIIPPWINKYYILDLKPKNSFVKWAVDQGLTVFLVSWVNPTKKHANKDFTDYMDEGILEALDVVQKVTGQDSINTIGYCLGGTLLSSTMAYLKAKKKDKLINSATFFTTMIDFTDVGETSIFIDEEQLAALDKKMDKQGYLEAEALQTTFNMLRANDLIWSFVVNNYLLGKDPFPFDLLYWNSDSTRMPAKMHSFYLHNMYEKNNLVKKGSIVLHDVPIDISTIDTPSYFISSKEDHIAPWKTTYTGATMLSGDVTFVLAASGHIAGIVNPPAKEKYCHWINSKLEKDCDTWFEKAKRTDGSWWPHWIKWISPKSGKKIKPPAMGGGKYKPLEDAPGSFVKVRAV